MRSPSRRFIRWYFAILLVPLAMGFLAFFIYDPLQIYHRPWGRPGTLHSNFRLQAAGIIRQQDFDGVILGTSMTENTSARTASRLFSTRMVNLSITAADFYERSLVLDDLFRRKPLRRVIYTLDHIYISTRKGYPLYPLPTFDFLYDRNPFNDVRAYLNSHFATCLLHASKAPDCIGTAADLDRPNAWIAQPEYALRFGGLEKWCAARDNYQIRDALKLIAKALDDMDSGTDAAPAAEEIGRRTDAAIRYVDDNLLRHVREHPETQFDLIFPAYFRATFAIWYQARPLHSAIHAAVVRHLAEAADRLPNLSVSGFETEGFPDDIASYKDLGHYHDGIDAAVLAAVASGRNRLNRTNVESYLAVSAQRARSFDLRNLRDELRRCGVTYQ